MCLYTQWSAAYLFLQPSTPTLLHMPTAVASHNSFSLETVTQPVCALLLAGCQPDHCLIGQLVVRTGIVSSMLGACVAHCACDVFIRQIGLLQPSGFRVEPWQHGSCSFRRQVWRARRRCSTGSCGYGVPALIQQWQLSRSRPQRSAKLSAR